jgi:hypothetical protein
MPLADMTTLKTWISSLSVSDQKGLTKQAPKEARKLSRLSRMAIIIALVYEALEEVDHSVSL